MATREQVHELVEELPEADLDSVAENLTARRDPETVRPGDIVDDWGNLSALRRSSAEKVRHLSGQLGHLSRAEIAEFGETPLRSWGWAWRIIGGSTWGNV